MLESEKQRYKDCKVKSPNAYACKSDSSSKAKYLSIQRRNKLFVVGLFFFAFVFCLSAMFIAPNKMTPQTTTPTPVNAEVITGDCGPVGSESSVTYSYDSETKTLTISGRGPMKDCVIWDKGEIVEKFSSPFTDFVENVTKIIIEGDVTSIGGGVFSGCSSLTNVTIPNSVTSIGAGAFWECSSLTSITISSYVTSIGYSAFAGCSGLVTITVDSNNTVYDSRNNCNAIIETSTNTLIAGCKNTTIPNNVTSIGYCAFDGSGFTSITIPSSVTSIGEGAFEYCENLTSITIPEGVMSIGVRAFNGCSSLTSIEIPDSVTSIDADALNGCSANLTIYGSGNENSAAYIYAQSNNINYVTASAPVSCSVTINFNANIKREFIVYVLGSDGNPTRQLVMKNGNSYTITGLKQGEKFSILVAETLYSTCTFKDTATGETKQTRKKEFANGIDGNKTIEISISSASNSINNWVIL